MHALRVSLLQDTIVPNDPEANLDHFASLLSEPLSSDLIVLPEVFTTGFCAGARRYAEEVDGRAYEWMSQIASIQSAVITGSLVVKEGGDYVNRMVWMRPDGTYSHYDKRHLFRMAGEHLRYRMGMERIVVEHKGWRILPLVCYDLRFPVWSRNRNDYDLAIFVANWPQTRALHWNALLQARAIENLSYVVGVNRVGTDEAGQLYSGDSTIIAPDGRLLATSQNACILTETLSHAELTAYRDRFPAHLDMDDFTLNLQS